MVDLGQELAEKILFEHENFGWHVGLVIEARRLLDELTNSAEEKGR
jgi:hypothetical protein